MLNPDDSGKVRGGKAARSAKSGRQGQRTDRSMLDRIYAAVQERPTIRAAELYREMDADEALRPLLPELRAFRGHVAQARERIDRDRWQPADEPNPDDARLVLEVLGRLALVQEGMSRWRGPDDEPMRPDWVTPRIAKWIIRLRHWIPGQAGAGDYLEPARMYAARELRGGPTDDLDDIVAKIAGRSWPERKEGTE